MRSLFVIAVVIGGLLISSPNRLFACGDADNNHALSIADVVYGMQYLFNGGPPPANFDYADFDQHSEWTVNDARWIFHCSFVDCWPTSNHCPPSLPPLDPPVTPGYRLRHTAAFPKLTTNMVFDIALDVASAVDGIQLPLRIIIEGGDTVVIDSVKYPLWENPNYWIKYFTLSPDRRSFVMGALGLFGDIDEPCPLARLYISAPMATESRILTLEFADYVPAQAPPGHQVPIVPMLVGYSGVWKPSIYGTCCLVPGDANGDGRTSIADVVFIINYTFAGGPPPLGCFLLGDADGNGALSIADAVWLINYIFSGGRPPMCR